MRDERLYLVVPPCFAGTSRCGPRRVRGQRSHQRLTRYPSDCNGRWFRDLSAASAATTCPAAPTRYGIFQAAARRPFSIGRGGTASQLARLSGTSSSIYSSSSSPFDVRSAAAYPDGKHTGQKNRPGGSRGRRRWSPYLAERFRRSWHRVTRCHAPLVAGLRRAFSLCHSG